MPIEMRLDFGWSGFSSNSITRFCVVGRQHAVAVRLVHRHLVQRHRDVGARREVMRDQFVVVHLVDVVAGEDQHRSRRASLRGSRRSARRRRRCRGTSRELSRPRYGCSSVTPPPCRSRSQGRPMPMWSLSERGRYCVSTPTRVTPGVHAVAQREVDDPVAAAEDHRRLGALFAEHAQAVALAPGQDQRHDSLHRPSSI